MPEKGEGLHRLSSKSGKPTASGRKYQKVIVVAEKSQQVHLQTSGGQGKGWCLFLLSNQPCTEGVTCCGCLISTSLSQLETCQPSAETISTVTEILISSSPDCTSLSLGDVSFYTRHNTFFSTLLPAHRTVTGAAQRRQLGSSQSPKSI